MFLNELNKKESIAFINLVTLLAQTDNSYSEKEKELIADYKNELSLKDETLESLSFEAAIKELNNSTPRIKNIIYFELVGLALIDGVYEDSEIDYLNKLASSFNISKDKQNDYVTYFKVVKDLYDATFIDYESKLKTLEKKASKLLE